MTISPLYFLGCDPDTHTMPWAIVGQDYHPVAVGMIRSPKTNSVMDMLDEMSKGFTHINDLKKSRMTAHSCELITHSCVAFAVESQELYTEGPHKTPNPRSILHLGQVAGAMYFMCRSWHREAMGFFPRPAEWKGQVGKQAHHHRIATRGDMPDTVLMGGKDPYLSVVPNSATARSIFGAGDMVPSDWKHVFDAIGLAQYVAEKYLYLTTKEKMLTAARYLPQGSDHV